MIFHETAIPGIISIEASPARDERGAFVRSWCRESFAAAGIEFTPIQASLSENTRQHTLRGMHFQIAPAEEQKLIRCVRGAQCLIRVYRDEGVELLAVALDLPKAGSSQCRGSEPARRHLGRERVHRHEGEVVIGSCHGAVPIF